MEFPLGAYIYGTVFLRDYIELKLAHSTMTKIKRNEDDIADIEEPSC